jgi:lactaldehyde dehydrogenase/glycolaldehyde dehydrogenase
MLVGDKMKQYQMFIDGKFIENEQHQMISVINPASEEILSEVPSGTKDDVDRAVKAAYQAQKNWAKKTAVARASYVKKIAALVRENAQHLIKILAAEQGKTVELATTEVNFTADYMDYMAGFARRIEGEVIESDRENEQIYLHKLPVGVVAGILPWNFPFFLIARKVAPALVAGNTIVIKPSSDTPNNAFEFARLVSQSGLPKGVFNLVSGRGGVVGNKLASHPLVGLISLTGSVESGIKIMEAAASNVTKVSLELGGKAPAIVMPDADLDLAAKAIRDSRVINSGQVCNCAERVYVHESIAEAFTEKLIEQMRQTKWGDPLTESGLDMGPLVSEKQLESVQAAVDSAIQQGAECLLGGKRAQTDKGFFFEPTVLRGQH